MFGRKKPFGYYKLEVPPGDLNRARSDLKAIIGCFASSIHDVLLDVGLEYDASWDDHAFRAKSRLGEIGIITDPEWLIAIVHPPVVFEELNSIVALMVVGSSSEVELTQPRQMLLSCKVDLIILYISEAQMLILRTFRPDIADRLTFLP